jgi:hypothetical protein
MAHAALSFTPSLRDTRRTESTVSNLRSRNIAVSCDSVRQYEGIDGGLQQENEARARNSTQDCPFYPPLYA